MHFASKILLLTMLAFYPSSITSADEPLPTIQTMADKDVLAVAYVDLGSIDVKNCFEWAVKQGIVPPDAAKQIKPMTMMARGMLDQVKEAGADHLIALIKQDDLLMRHPPLFVISISKGKSTEDAIQTLKQAASMLQIRDFQMEVWNNAILAGSAKQIARAKATPSIDRPNLTKAWKTFGGQDVGAIVIGSPDARRVVREMFPKMQPPFEKITGEMIADKLMSGGLAIKLPADTHAKIIVQTKDPESAKTLLDAAIAGKKMLAAQNGQDSQSLPMGFSLLARAATNLEPQVVGSDAVIDLDPLLNNEAKLMELLEPIRESARDTQRKNNLRQIVVAMHNYESAHRSFPAQLSADENGKPLLSWRVHLLPFLNQAQLYKQFKLDEPWDSPHNIEIVKEMPKIYGDPSSRSGGLNDAGKTRYLVPVGKDTVFGGNEGTKIRNMTDGTSNTIAVVRASANAAIVWTKPADWDVDPNSPKKGLFSKGDSQTIVARCDGAVTRLDSEISDETLKAALTKNGGEVVDF